MMCISSPSIGLLALFMLDRARGRAVWILGSISEPKHMLGRSIESIGSIDAVSDP